MQIPNFLSEISHLTPQAIYLVGGGVRDLLMGYSLYDYDLLCADSALDFARLLEKQNIAVIKSIHEPFGTVKIILNSSQKQIIDLATSRKEIYTNAGELPIVSFPAPLKEDLGRRDFSINAIAYNLQTKEFIDPIDGRKDLEKKIIKVLHSRSYWEDPTRIIRAIRFANRFNFKIINTDLELIQKALEDNYLHGLIQKIRGARVGIELKRLLENKNWFKGANLLFDIGGFNLLRSNLKIVIDEYKIIFPLDSWESRLIWLLQKEKDLNNIMSEIEIRNNIQKQIHFIFELNQNNDLKPSLKLFNKINQLDKDYQNLLFNLNPNIYYLFLKMQKAEPQLKPQELKENGFFGKEISVELEKIFLENFDLI